MGVSDTNTVNMIDYARVGNTPCPTDAPRGLDRCEVHRATNHEHDITRFKPVDTSRSILALPDPVKPFRDPSAAAVSGV
jgi:hypothetical protein